MNPESNELQTLNILGQVLGMYLSDREHALTKYQKDIADLKIKIEVLNRHNDILQKVSDAMFAQLKRTRNLCMQSLDIAIANGDKNIAEISIKTIERIFTKDIVSQIEERMRK